MSVSPALRTWTLLLVLLWSPRSFTRAQQLVVQQADAGRITALSDLPKKFDGDPTKRRLKLCDCEVGTAEPGGLSCAKEGFFVASFQHQGQWVAGGGAVPLSKAICCRPCMPEELPDDPDGRIPPGQRPVAVVSLGCHSSSESISLRCETDGASFISGFTNAVHIYSSDAYYPIDSAQCCTPSLLLDGGDAWELERCDCHFSSDAAFPVNCGGNATDALLQGFNSFRLTPLGQVVPVGPAQCCGVCLSKAVHPIDDCSTLGNCHNQGVCLLGRCECLRGWGGADCSLPLGGRGFAGRVPPWAIALIIIGSCVLSMALIAVAAHLSSLVHDQMTGGGEGGDASRPLLLRIDGDDRGSVGSQDTDSDEDIEDVEERIDEMINRLEERGSAAGSLPASPAAAAAAAPPGGRAPSAASEPHSASSSGSTLSQQPDIEAPAAEAEAPAAAGQESGEATAAEVQPAEAQEPAEKLAHLGSYAGVGPLAGVDCSVCMVRPVQTVVVPCGHIAMCRRCSRRLNRCPICRKDIVRRQRLYV